jgi:phenazine biosynthesis protein phzE
MQGCGWNLLEQVLAPRPPAFALIQRPRSAGPAELDVLVGDVSTPDTLAEIPLSERPGESGDQRHEMLAIIPYRQLAERGFECIDDGAPLISMAITDQGTLPTTLALHWLPNNPIRLADEHFDVDDHTYAEIVRAVVINEIGHGKGANFVIKRSLTAEIANYSLASALAFFRRLVERESGAYWTFIVHTGSRTFVGATPERHLSMQSGIAIMNPVSGTYRYPPSGPTLTGVLDFLMDRKETDELYMVLDEELKMMARICDSGGRVVGPHLREMTRLAHTEYFIEGHTTLGPREILRETMFASTVTGCPLESACRVIKNYERSGRGYYSGVLALIGRDQHGQRTMDSAIAIRTAEIDPTGQMRIGVGATLVRHSDPASEVAETAAKVAGLRDALTLDTPNRFGDHPTVRAALQARNSSLADFWLSANGVWKPQPDLVGRRVLVVDAEDTFTAMLDHQLRTLGIKVTVRRFDQPYSLDNYDLVVMGPGPGDPTEEDDPKITHLRGSLRSLIDRRRPLLAVCLSHQVLALELGFEVGRKGVPHQGLQAEIDLFGSRERVGFYNTFAARCNEDGVHRTGVGAIEVSRDVRTGEVHALRGAGFASVQFHPESVLTQGGVRILETLVAGALAAH